MKKRLSVFVSFTVAALLSSNSMAAITTEYDNEVDNGKVQVFDLHATGNSQTMLVLSSDAQNVGFDDVVWLNQKDDGPAFDAVYLKSGAYAELIEGESKTYYIRVAGSDGTIQTGTFTLEKAESTPTPTLEPTEEPTDEPIWEETEEPTVVPTVAPTAEPTAAPTAEPTAVPTAEPTGAPTAEPTAEPTAAPTAEPTEVPTTEPTAQPTSVPTEAATTVPTTVPTTEPTAGPTEVPTTVPTAGPTEAPTPAVPDIKCRIEVNAEEAEATAHILNTYDEDKSVVITVAQYDSEVNLISIMSKEIVVPHNTESPKVYTVKFDQIKPNMDHVRCFVWDGFKTMKPITELKE